MQQSDHRRGRRPRQFQQFVLQPGHVAYRVICHFSIIGGLIGTSGSIISQIRRDTGCIIHCELKVQDSDHRVILVAGPASPGRRIVLKSMEDDDEEETELVSVSQEAVIRVCERMWEVEAQKGRVDGSESDVREGYCGLLADRTQIGALMGRGGRNVVRMRRESGAQIIILPPPQCATKDDQLIQITGTILAVKKALVAVTECLHDCPPYDRGPMLLNRNIERSSQLASSDPHAEFFPNLSSLLPPLNGNSADTHSLPSDVDGDPNQAVEAIQQEVSFRLICSNTAAGSIIGKKGTIVRTLQNESGASIMFSAPTTMSDERIVTISAMENLESWYSPAQNAVVLVFARSIEHDIEKGHLPVLIKGTTVTARLLVESEVVCCLNGNDGEIESELIEVSGADIKILQGEHSSECSSENDAVMEITGEYENVQNALFLVTGKLRNTLLPSRVLDEVKVKRPQGRVMEISSHRLQQLAALSRNSDTKTNLTSAMDGLGLSSSSSFSNASSLGMEKFGKETSTTSKNNENRSAAFGGGSSLERSLHFLLPKEVLNEVGAKSPGVREDTCFESHSSIGQACSPMDVAASLLSSHISQTVGGVGSTNFGGSIQPESTLCSRKKCIVANTVVELLVSEDIIGSVYGENGSNLARLREISGAKVEVQNPSPSKSDRMVVITGTPDQTRAAQSLLHAFILADDK